MATAITMGPDGLEVPDEPIIPFIEGDGIGPDIWAAARAVFDAAAAGMNRFANQLLKSDPSTKPSPEKSPLAHDFAQPWNLWLFQMLKSEPSTTPSRLASPTRDPSRLSTRNVPKNGFTLRNNSNC